MVRRRQIIVVLGKRLRSSWQPVQKNRQVGGRFSSRLATRPLPHTGSGKTYSRRPRSCRAVHWTYPRIACTSRNSHGTGNPLVWWRRPRYISSHSDTLLIICGRLFEVVLTPTHIYPLFSCRHRGGDLRVVDEDNDSQRTGSNNCTSYATIREFKSGDKVAFVVPFVFSNAYYHIAKVTVQPTIGSLYLSTTSSLRRVAASTSMHPVNITTLLRDYPPGAHCPRSS